MNKIQNGDFSSGFNYWDNGVGGFPYVLDSGRAKATSYSSSTNEKLYRMTQEFTVNNEVLSASITVWGQWRAYSGSPDGYNNFEVYLKKPDTSYVTLLDTTKTALVGSGNLLDGQDISSNFDQYGNYEIVLTLKTASAYQWSERLQQYIYALSYGYYDNISIDIAVKKYKTVHEILGSAGVLNGKASVSRSEIVGLSEAYSTEVRPCQYETASGVVGLSESLSAQITRKPSVLEGMGLLEKLQATRTQGNIITTFDISDLTDWNETGAVTTPWIKEKTEIN